MQMGSKILSALSPISCFHAHLSWVLSSYMETHVDSQRMSLSVYKWDFTVHHHVKSWGQKCLQAFTSPCGIWYWHIKCSEITYSEPYVGAAAYGMILEIPQKAPCSQISLLTVTRCGSYCITCNPFIPQLGVVFKADNPNFLKKRIHWIY